MPAALLYARANPRPPANNQPEPLNADLNWRRLARVRTAFGGYGLGRAPVPTLVPNRASPSSIHEHYRGLGFA